jgi:hypothetical protein
LEIVEPADYVHASSFIHLVDAETQNDVCRRLTRICKGAITERQEDALVAEERIRRTLPMGNRRLHHSSETFTHMWDEVTDEKWEVESATLQTRVGVERVRQVLTFLVRKKKEQ